MFTPYSALDGVVVRSPRRQKRKKQSVRLQPRLSRLVEVATGSSSWTPEEEKWLERHPEWRSYEGRLRDAIEAFETIIDP